VPRAFLTLGADVACSRQPAPWDALYRVLWRLTHGERALLDVYVDEDVHALHRMAKAVRREGHKLRAFVRFRLVHPPGAEARYVAWFEPAHDVLAREAPFFARRFPAMSWSILTPDKSAHWDGRSLVYGAGVPRAEAPQGDVLEELWRTYYAHTFNPARVKPKMMRAEMPVRYWKHLPEASLIAPLLREAPARVQQMLEQQRVAARAPIFPVLPRGAAGAAGGVAAAVSAAVSAGMSAPPEGEFRAERASTRHPNPAFLGEDAQASVVVHDEGVRAAHDRSTRARALLEQRQIAAGASPIAGGDVRVGTASWTDPTMTAAGVFYPPAVHDAQGRLAYYASRFSLVEVDATYYALPTEQVAERWAERTPDGFVFDIKAHALMTGHATDVARLPRALRDALPRRLAGATTVRAAELPAELIEEVWRRFIAALAPLQRAGKLGALLLQLPRTLTAAEHGERMIAALRARAGDLACAVELRHASWLTGADRTARTLDLLRAHDLAFVMVDAPPGFATSMPRVAAVTSDRLAVVRLHGRRRETWETPVRVVSERYRYLYDAAELGEWVPRIIDVAQRTQGVHVVMNNCHANYGTTNADEITALLVEFDLERRRLQ
jgi:probable DNA metabolism protein